MELVHRDREYKDDEEGGQLARQRNTRPSAKEKERQSHRVSSATHYHVVETWLSSAQETSVVPAQNLHALILPVIKAAQPTTTPISHKHQNTHGKARQSDLYFNVFTYEGQFNCKGGEICGCEVVNFFVAFQFRLWIACRPHSYERMEKESPESVCRLPSSMRTRASFKQARI